MLGIFYEIAIVGRRSAKLLGDDIHRVYIRCAILILIIWLLYPIAWGLSEGGNVITPNDEGVFYGCLDFFSKPVFCILLLTGHWNIDPGRLGLRIMEPDDVATRPGNRYAANGNGAHPQEDGPKDE